MSEIPNFGSFFHLFGILFHLIYLIIMYFCNIIYILKLFMKKPLLLMSAMVALSMGTLAQTVYKVDISEFNRNNMEEILEPGFTVWQPKQKDFNEQTLTVGCPGQTSKSGPFGHARKC